MRITKGFALRIRQEYHADNPEICKMLDLAMGRMSRSEELEVETSIEWHLRNGCQFTPSPEEVVQLFNKGSGIVLAVNAAQCLRRKKLLDEYFELQKAQAPSLTFEPATQPVKLKKNMFRLPNPWTSLSNLF